MLALVGLPAGGAQRSAVLANPELALSHATALVPGLRLQSGLALAIPLGGRAARGPLDSEALALADSLTGGARPGLFLPGRFTATPSLELTWKLAPAETTRLCATAFASTPLALAAGTRAAGQAHRLAVAVVAGGRLGLRRGRLLVELDGWTRFDPVRAEALAARPGPLLVLAPRAGVHTRRLALTAGALMHLDGDLGPRRLALTTELVARF